MDPLTPPPEPPEAGPPQPAPEAAPPRPATSGTGPLRESSSILRVAPPAEAPPAPGALERLTRGVIGWFEANQLGGVRAALIGAGLAGVSGACFGISHAGFAGVLGLVATFFLWIAAGDAHRTQESPGIRRPFVELLAGTADLLIIGGLALEGASRGNVGRVLLAVAVLGLFMLLPRAQEGGSVRRRVDLWAPDERRLVLLVSALFGHTALPLLLIVIVGFTDLTIRLLRMASALKLPPAPDPLPTVLRALYLPSGRPHPGVRIAAALGVVVLLLVLGKESGWSF